MKRFTYSDDMNVLRGTIWFFAKCQEVNIVVLGKMIEEEIIKNALPFTEISNCDQDQRPLEILFTEQSIAAQISDST